MSLRKPTPWEIKRRACESRHARVERSVLKRSSKTYKHTFWDMFYWDYNHWLTDWANKKPGKLYQ